MQTSQFTSIRYSRFQTVLRSQGGVHLSFYVNEHSPTMRRKALKAHMNSATITLKGVLGNREIESLFEPIRRLLENADLLSGMTGSFGLFRSCDHFEVISIPIEVNNQWHVADSFHVKPLLKWLQNESEFVLVGLDLNRAYIYLGGQSWLQKVETIILPDFLGHMDALTDVIGLRRLRETRDQADRAYAWLNRWLKQFLNGDDLPIFVVGESSRLEAYLRNSCMERAPYVLRKQLFVESDVQRFVTLARKALKEVSSVNYKETIAVLRRSTTLNEFQLPMIFEAVKSGKVRTVLVAEDVTIHGRIDRDTGAARLHLQDQDHEDDDLLDDLAQSAISTGASVWVVKRSAMPGQRALLVELK